MVLFSRPLLPGIFAFVITASLALPATAASERDESQMTASHPTELFRKTVLVEIAKAEQKLGCRIGLYFKDKDLPLEAGHHADEWFHAASTMKVPVMIEVFRQAEQGRFKMTDTLLVDPIFHSMIDDSTFECEGYQYINSRIGQQETILKLTEQMIDVSDNLATNLLITLCDARKITGTARALGATTTLVLRCVMDIPAFDAGLSNRVSPRDLGILMEAIETNRAAGEESCREMRRILLAQEHREMIPARLPEGVRVAHKTGAIEGIQHDAAIVYAPFGTYYLVLMSDGLTDSKAGIAELARLSRFIYDERAKLGSR